MLYEVGRSSHPLSDADCGRSRIPQSLPPRNPHAADIPVFKLVACRKQRVFYFASAIAIPNKVHVVLHPWPRFSSEAPRSCVSLSTTHVVMKMRYTHHVPFVSRAALA